MPSTSTSCSLPDLSKYPVLFEADLDLPLLQRGKVRDVFDLGEHVLVVATDRISVHNRVMATPIPLKGHVLTRMCAFWFDETRHIIENHFLTADLDEMKSRYGHDLDRWRDQLQGRTMLVRKAEVLPTTCVVRGYLYGSGWREYQDKRTICGHEMRKGLRIGSRFPAPLLTPATQRPEGGRIANISMEQMSGMIGPKLAQTIAEASLEIYKFAAKYCLEHGVILADTKLEYGVVNGEPMLVDELITPDSSRLWPRDAYTPGKHQLAFDKQFIRDYLRAIGWESDDEAPPLPDKVITKSTEKYFTACQQLLGQQDF